MKRRRLGYAVWLGLAACLYFFENNTGTRAVLLCALVFPLIPPLRAALFSPEAPEKTEAPEAQTAGAFVLRETDEPGDVRPYAPGDPVRRIHWKLSARKGELLVRETAPEKTWEEAARPASSPPPRSSAAAAKAVSAAAMRSTASAVLWPSGTEKYRYA